MSMVAGRISAERALQEDEKKKRTSKTSPTEAFLDSRPNSMVDPKAVSPDGLGAAPVVTKPRNTLRRS